MSVQPAERKLAAIFAADIAGYSRLMARDEVGTLARLKACRIIIDGLIASHRGRIFNTAGRQRRRRLRQRRRCSAMRGRGAGRDRHGKCRRYRRRADAVPCAFVTLKDGASAEPAEIIAFCRAHLGHFKAPRRVVFGPLPKTSTGKIQKFVLRERAKELR